MTTDDEPGTAHLVAALRERIYASITGIATLMTLYAYAEDSTGRAAAAGLLAAMFGLFAAGLLADLIAHTSADGRPPSRVVRRELARVSWQAVEISVLPVVLLLLTDAGWWSLRTGIGLAALSLGLTQLGLLLWGMRRSAASPLTKIVYLVLNVAALAIVVGIKVAAH